MNLLADKAKKTFLLLWIGQLISNLGTQTSLYGIGLWFFANTQRLMDFALVALTVQLARIIVLPLIGVRLAQWSRKRVMLISNAIGALCTIAFAGLLLQGDAIPLLLPLLLLQAIAAMAEATLILSFSSLIPILFVDKDSLIRANGLFASTDSLILALAPFLGTWLSGLLGLKGVLALDGLSFLLALIFVLAAPWSPQFTRLSKKSAAWNGFQTIKHLKMLKQLWTRFPLAKVALVMTSAIAFSYAATEVLFPAWVAVSYGTSHMALVIFVAFIGYGFGLLAWQKSLGFQWKRIWLNMVFIQALVLMGAGLQFFASQEFIWFLGVLIFSFGLPIVMSSVQQAWSQLAPPEDLPGIYAIRYTFEWSARLIAFITISLVVDQVIQPILTWQNFPYWLKLSLGTGDGRAIAVTLGAMGWVLLLSSINQKKNLHSTIYK